MDTLTRRYLELVERIAGYPVTDPAARARVLVEIKAIYRAELQAARSAAALNASSTGHDGSPKL